MTNTNKYNTWGTERLFKKLESNDIKLLKSKQSRTGGIREENNAIFKELKKRKGPELDKILDKYFKIMR